MQRNLKDMEIIEWKNNTYKDEIFTSEKMCVIKKYINNKLLKIEFVFGKQALNLHNNLNNQTSN